jgi:hypothetical protein
LNFQVCKALSYPEKYTLQLILTSFKTTTVYWFTLKDICTRAMTLTSGAYFHNTFTNQSTNRLELYSTKWGTSISRMDLNKTTLKMALHVDRNTLAYYRRSNKNATIKEKCWWIYRTMRSTTKIQNRKTANPQKKLKYDDEYESVTQIYSW